MAWGAKKGDFEISGEEMENIHRLQHHLDESIRYLEGLATHKRFRDLDEVIQRLENNQQFVLLLQGLKTMQAKANAQRNIPTESQGVESTS